MKTRICHFCRVGSRWEEKKALKDDAILPCRSPFLKNSDLSRTVNAYVWEWGVRRERFRVLFRLYMRGDEMTETLGSYTKWGLRLVMWNFIFLCGSRKCPPWFILIRITATLFTYVSISCAIRVSNSKNIKF